MKQLLPRLLLFAALGSQTPLFAQAQEIPRSRVDASVLPPAPPPTAPAATIEELAAKVEELTATTDAFEDKASGWDRFVERLPRISGFVQTGYEWSERSSNFSIKRLRLNIAGDLGSKIDYRIQFEFTSPKILDAYVQYKPFTQLNLRVGEFPLPFLFENVEYAPTKLEFIDYSLAVQRLMGHNDLCGVSAAGRDVGFMVWGGFIKRDGYSIINYDVGVFNGEGINLRDANRSKDVVARLTLKPIAGLQIGASLYWGEAGGDYRQRTRYGVGVVYDCGRVVARGEYIYGTTGLPASAPDPIVEVDSEGWTAIVGFRATKSLMPVVRYEAFVGNRTHAWATRQTNYTAGLVWLPIKYLRCQLQYTYQAHGGATADCNVVAVMFSGIF